MVYLFGKIWGKFGNLQGKPWGWLSKNLALFLLRLRL